MRSYRNPFLLFFFLICATRVIYSIDINQSDIPFVITAPGTYNLVEDVTYKGQNNAITIKSSNVELNLNVFSITLLHHQAIGIFAKNISSFSINNGSIRNKHNESKKGSGIHIADSFKGTISNIDTINNRNGIFIHKSDSIEVNDSNFFHASKSGALVKDSKAVEFNNCVFTHCQNGLRIEGASTTCRVTNSEFPNSKLSNLYVERINGMIIENCLFDNHGASNQKPNIIQFGGASSLQRCNDVIMKNCTVVNRPKTCPTLGNTSPEGIGIYQGSGFLIDSCVIDINNTNQDPAADLSGIHISNPGLGINGTIATNVIIINCILQGPATDGIYPDVGSSDVLIENNLVANAQKDGIFLAGTISATVINNTVVNNGTNGIFVGEVSSSNAIINNVVNNNGFNPITTSLPPVGNGISIASDSSLNIVQGNAVFSNAVNGIDDLGTNNRIFSNTAYDNANLNYHTATDPIVVSAPGSATLTGANTNA